MADPKIVIGAVDNASKVLAQVRANLGGLQTTAAKLGPLLASLGASLTLGAAFAFASGIVKGVDALNDLKDATGASIENISALEDVAARTGTSFEAVGTSLVKFNAALKGGEPGSNAEKALTAIGLSIKELRALDPAEALRQTAVALSQFADDGNKARLTQELFGKSLREVAPFLNDLAKQGALVATVTTKQAEEAEKFNNQLLGLQKNSTDAARSLVIDLVPALSRSLEHFVRLRALGGLGEIFKDAAKDVLSFGLANRLTQTPLADLNRLTADYTALLEKQNKERFKGVAGLENKSLKSDIAQTAKLIEITKVRLGLTDGSAGGGRGNVNPPLPAKPSVAGNLFDSIKKTHKDKEQITEAQRALASYVEALQNAIDKTQDLNEVQKATDFLKGIGKAGAVAEVRELVLGMAAQIDKEHELSKAIRASVEAYEDEAKALRTLEDARQSNIAALDDEINRLSGRADDERKRLLTTRLETQLSAGAIFSPEELDRVVRGIGGVNEELVKTKSFAEDLGLSFSSAFEDAIVGGKKFSEVLRGLEQDILKIVTRKLITEPLGNALTDGLKGVFGGSGFFGSLFKADGGPVSGGQPYIVGERGPEMFLPSSSGTIIPNNRLGAGRTYNININPPAGMSRQSSSQFALGVVRQLRMVESRDT